MIGGLVRMLGDLARSEDLAQEALLIALERWPEQGIPENPGAWLMTTAKRRAIDEIRRTEMMGRKHADLKHAAEPTVDEADLDEAVGDDVLRLIFITCHPVLNTEARVALTLRFGGRLDDRRNRSRIPGARADAGSAPGARETHPGRGAGTFRAAAGR